MSYIIQSTYLHFEIDYILTTIFKQIAGLCFSFYIINLLCYTSMDSSRRALQTNGNLFWNSNSFLNYWPKINKYSNKLRGVNIDQSAMCIIVICQWIHFNKLYKMMESFFFKYKIIFELASYMPEKKFQRDSVASILIESHGFNVSCCVSFRVELQVLWELQFF